MRDYIRLRIDELEREIKNELRDAITETTVIMMQWKDGKFPECENIGDIREKIYKEFDLCD